MSGMKFEKEIFMKYLIEREASEATKKKYMTDVTTFYSYAAEAEEIDKELLLAYREWLVIIPGLSEPPVRTLRATCPENESHIFR